MNKHLVGISSGLVALLLALLSAFFWLDRRVDALSNSPITFAQVEHVVDLKTRDKLDEIIRRLVRIEAQMDNVSSVAKAVKP